MYRMDWEGPFSSSDRIEQEQRWKILKRFVRRHCKDEFWKHVFHVFVCDPSVFQFRLDSIFQIIVDFHFTSWKLGFLNISEYLARYSIQMDPSVTERRWQSGKKPVLCMLGLLSTIIRGMERADQESVYHSMIALAHEHNWAPITSTSAREVARTSARRLRHPARAGIFLVFFSQPPTLCWSFGNGHFTESPLRPCLISNFASLDSARLLGESWWKKIEGLLGEKNAHKSRNSC